MRAVVLAALGAVVATPSTAHAVGACVPAATGAPWIGGAPNITDVSQLGGLNWTGSFGYDWQAGTTKTSDFRFVILKGSTDPTHAGYIYLYFRSKVVQTYVSNSDGVRFGLTVLNPGSGEKVAQSYEINMKGNQVSHPHLSAPVAKAPSTWAVSQRVTLGDPIDLGAPSWMADPQYVNTWIMPADGSTPGNPLFTWAITVRIPIKKLPSDAMGPLPVLDTAGNLIQTDTAGVFLNPDVVDPPAPMPAAPKTTVWGDMHWLPIGTLPPVGGTVPPVPQPTLWYPETVDAGQLPTNASVPPVPKLAKWNDAQLVAPSSGQCTTPGIFITEDDIFTSGGSWAGDLRAYTPPDTRFDNTIFVNVHNKGTAIDDTTAGTIHATFRIAPLGSASVKSNLWRELNDKGNKITLSCDTATPPNCNPALVPANPILGNFVTGSLSGTTDQTFRVQTTTPWTPDWSYICATYFDAEPGIPAQWGRDRFSSHCSAAAAPWQPTLIPPADGLGSHQCMLVELSSEDNRQFNQQSAFRNMHLGHASTFKEAAVIDSSGLPKLKGQTGRWMYLWLETRNLQRVVVPPVDTPSLTSIGKNVVEHNGLIFNASTRERLTYDQAAEFLPSFIVHVYRATDIKQKTLAKKTVNVLEEQPGYGFFITHEGELHGWRHAIAGAQKLAPDFYRVWVPNNKAVAVTNVVEAREKACEGHAFEKVRGQLEQLYSYLKSQGSPYADEVKTLIKSLSVECIDVYDLIQELKLQPDLQCIGKLLDQILEASGCHC